MINIPIDLLKQKILEKSGISEKEFDEKIKTKLEQLSGLISEEGAAHIIANELGINLMQSEGLVKVNNLLPGMKNVELVGKIQRMFELRTFEKGERKGKLSKFLVADESGQTMVVMWNNAADDIEKLKEDDIVKIKNASVRDNQGRTELHLSDEGNLEVNPEGITIGDVKKASGFGTPTRKKIKELTENDSNVEIFSTIVQIFDPKFFKINPETGKRIQDDDTSSNFGYGTVMNLFADDGSDNIRVVLWKNQILNLLGIDEEKLLTYREDPGSFEDVKTELLGMMVKFIGRVSKNEMFNRLEFVANLVIKDVNPDEEMKNLSKEKPVEEEVKEKKEDELLSLEDIEDLED